MKIKTKKSLGQNFLRDEGILKKIADFAHVEKGDTVVEVGPGEGGLTKILLERAEKVIAVEKDGRMVQFLNQKFESEIKNGKLEVIDGDIIDLSLDKSSCSLSTHKILLNFCSARLVSLRKARSQDFSQAPKYVLVGNIPYYITGALFKKALEAENPPKSLTFVVQREVAERVMARDGKESILSISIKAYGKPEYGGVIKAGSFHPSPKVDSAIIAVRDISKRRFEEITPQAPLTLRGDKNKKETPSAQTMVTKEAEERFFEIVRLGFAHKRKFLIKNLADVSKGTFDTLKMKEIFEKCGLDGKVRAEDLGVEDWFNLVNHLNS